MVGWVISFLAVFIFAAIPVNSPADTVNGKVTQCATFDLTTGNLKIPCLLIDKARYSIDLHYDGTGLDFIGYSTPVREDSVYYCSKFDFPSAAVRIPCIEFNGNRYRLDLGAASFPPLRFVPIDAGTSFTGPSLYNAGVSPLAGNDATLYTFYVNYLDEGGMAPSQATIYLDGSPNLMALMHGTPSDGVYSLTVQLPPGIHSYLMVFTEGTSGRRITMDSNYFYLPEVASGGNAPPSLYQADMSPVHGVEFDLFKFSVSLRDADGDPPVVKDLLLNLSGASAMNLSAGTPDYGRYSAELSLAGGCYCYGFGFSDGKVGTLFPSFGAFYGPSVDSRDYSFSPAVPIPAQCRRNINPELFNPGLAPVSGDECTAFTFQIDYFDFNGDPGATYVYIDGNPYWGYIKSGLPSNGTIVIQTRLLAGEHKYYFFAYDGRCGTARYPAVGEFELDVTPFSPAGLCPQEPPPPEEY